MKVMQALQADNRRWETTAGWIAGPFATIGTFVSTVPRSFRGFRPLYPREFGLGDLIERVSHELSGQLRMLPIRSVIEGY